MKPTPSGRARPQGRQRAAVGRRSLARASRRRRLQKILLGCVGSIYHPNPWPRALRAMWRVGRRVSRAARDPGVGRRPGSGGVRGSAGPALRSGASLRDRPATSLLGPTAVSEPVPVEVPGVGRGIVSRGLDRAGGRAGAGASRPYANAVRGGASSWAAPAPRACGPHVQ